MKPVFVFIAALLFSVSVFAQTTPAPWKERVVGNWKYVGTEEFGVVDSARAEQQNDKLEIAADGSYSKVEDGVAQKGTYTVTENAKTITLKPADGKAKTYNLKKAIAENLVIEFQTPDLIRTRYTFTKQQ